MFEKITIENFRGIRKSRIEGLNSVNLFFGKNNCGKSSFLEAVFLLAGQSNPGLPITINNLRNYGRFSEQDLSMEFYQLAKDKSIRISSEGDTSRALEISMVSSRGNEVELDALKTGISDPKAQYHGYQLRYKRDDTSKTYQSAVIIEEGSQKAKMNVDAAYEETLYAKYLPASSVSTPLADAFSVVVKEKKEKEITSILQGLEPKIADIQLVNQDLMVDVGLKERLPINMLGDGIRKLISIVLSVYECRNGILLIDEVDNGFHYSVMPNLWKAIISTAKANHVQVFATTHNIDSMKGLSAVLKENSDMRSDIAAFKLLKKKDDELMGLRYDYETFDFSIQQEIEMR